MGARQAAWGRYEGVSDSGRRWSLKSEFAGAGCLHACTHPLHGVQMHGVLLSQPADPTLTPVNPRMCRCSATKSGDEDREDGPRLPRLPGSLHGNVLRSGTTTEGLPQSMLQALQPGQLLRAVPWHACCELDAVCVSGSRVGLNKCNIIAEVLFISETRSMVNDQRDGVGKKVVFDVALWNFAILHVAAARH